MKETKIRKVFTGTNEYYVYDMKADMFGKRKRIYGRSESEVYQKIEEALQEQEQKILSLDVGEEKISDYIRCYFKGIVKNNNTSDVKRQLRFCERAVFGSQIDKNISEINEQDIQEFYNFLSQSYAYESIKDIDKIFKKIFEIAAIRNAKHIDFKSLTIPKVKLPRDGNNYIFSPEEYEEVLSFCIEDNCQRFGKNEQLITFCLFTGLKIDTVTKLTADNIDLKNGTITYRIGRSNPRDITAKLSDRCIQWLSQQADDGSLPLKSGNEDDSAGISRYTCTENTPLFTNSNGVSPTLQSIMSSITHLAIWLGFPKNVSAKSLHKSYVIYELENGANPSELYRRLGLSERRMITNIQNQYELQQSLK